MFFFFAISLFSGISCTYVGFFQVNLASELLANLIQRTSGPIAQPIENTSEMTRIFNGGLKINQRKWPLTMAEKEWWWMYAWHGRMDIKFVIIVFVRLARTCWTEQETSLHGSLVPPMMDSWWKQHAGCSWPEKMRKNVLLWYLTFKNMLCIGEV